ncbi:MAG: PIN domain-containing protein [Vulcanisaeta sp.]|jgi:predicted nucleic acid-binding protein|uniref:Ribonuclease VapC n=1 Tax=Vulcanisaeta moutnovskia (strain 768-28) TaxID=985053 RepID=F0QWE9_VULM7|nr:PIN domain-containing protein [Vulcanisaeta moutnovskia]ADY00997.1 predicted nucleic acid-binding protein, containing PIN domain [Vulcanisaeta moutnovskia 768-28]
MSEAVIDTNALIFYIVEDSREHTRAVRVLDSLDRWFLHHIVIYELVWFFRSVNVPRDHAMDILGSLINHRKVVLVCDNDIIKWVLRMMQSTGWGLGGFNDLVVLGTAYALGKPLFTFDEELRIRAKKVGVRVLEV